MGVWGEEKRKRETGGTVLLLWTSGSLERKTVAPLDYTCLPCVPFIFALSRFTQKVSGYGSRKGGS